MWSPKVKAGHRPTFLAVVQYVNLGSDPSGNDQCGGDRSHPPPIRLLTIWLAAVSMSSLTLVTIRPSKEQNKRETIEGPGIQQIPTEARFTNLFFPTLGRRSFRFTIASLLLLMMMMKKMMVKKMMVKK